MITSKLVWLKERQLALTEELAKECNINSKIHNELTNELRQLLNQIQQEENWKRMLEMSNKTYIDYISEALNEQISKTNNQRTL